MEMKKSRWRGNITPYVRPECEEEDDLDELWEDFFDEYPVMRETSVREDYDSPPDWVGTVCYLEALADYCDNDAAEMEGKDIYYLGDSLDEIGRSRVEGDLPDYLVHWFNFEAYAEDFLDGISYHEFNGEYYEIE